MADPFKITEPTAISFSGGRTSAYMLWRTLQANDGLPSEAKVLFANTGKEHHATLDFINECAVRWDCPIEWVEYRQGKTFELVSYETASRNGEPFETIIRERGMLPNVRSRFCTQEMKIDTMLRYLKSLGWKEHTNFVGIRYDEPRRAAKMQPRLKIQEPRMPLFEAKVTRQEVLDFWAKNDFDLGLPIIQGETIGGNCDLCFLKSFPKILALIKHEPERAVWWAKMESLPEIVNKGGSGHLFRNDRPRYEEMKNFINHQADMFDESIECFCGD